MKGIKIITLVGLMFFVGNNAQAQFWKKLKERVEKSVEKSVLDNADRKSSKTVDDAFDVKLGKSKKKKSSSSSRVFSFTNEIVLDTRMTTEKDEEGESFDMKSTVKYLFDAFSPDVVGIEMTIYMNNENEEGEMEENEMTTFMVMDGKELKLYDREDMRTIELPIGKMVKLSYDNYWDEGVEITKTGRSEIILGYRCDEYKLISNKDNTKGNFFITREPVFNNEVMKKIASKTAQYKLFKKGGMMLKGQFSIKTGGTMTITPKRVSSSNVIINENDYDN